MKSYSRIFFIFAGLLAAVSAVFTGCAHTIPVVPHPPLHTGADKIPLDIGLYVSDELTNYQVSEYKMGDQWNYTNLGTASASQFKLYLDHYFLSVELVDRLPPFPDEKKITVHAVLEPRIEQFDFDIPFTKFQVYPARIRYLIKVYDINGNIILKEEVEGIGDTQGQAGFDFSENPSKSASKAVEDGVKKAVEEIAKSDKIRRLNDYAKSVDPYQYKGESVLKPLSTGQPDQTTSLKAQLEAEKMRIADEEAQIERLRQELAQLKAEGGQLEETETPQLASIPKEVPKPKISLRKEPKILSRRDVRHMLLKYHFFDIEQNPSGNFANDFITNADSTITDRITGLMWQKRGSSKDLSRREAKRYVEKLNQERFAGYSNWRMPTIEELASLMMHTKKRGLYINPVFDSRQIRCWSADQGTGGITEYYRDFIISFSNGHISISATTRSHYQYTGMYWGAKNRTNYV
ncbi:MAG: DUF1566 domain-containing protein, partial [Desulfobacterales bacterium]